MLQGRDILKGNDSIEGGGANDQLFGGSDDDTLDGGKENDKLFGGSGDDRLLVGRGNDILSGDDGVDVFVMTHGNDIIKDFDIENERLDFSGPDSLRTFNNLKELSKFVTSGTASQTVIEIGANKLTIQGVVFEEMSVFNFEFA